MAKTKAKTKKPVAKPKTKTRAAKAPKAKAKPKARPKAKPKAKPAAKPKAKAAPAKPAPAKAAPAKAKPAKAAPAKAKPAKAVAKAPRPKPVKETAPARIKPGFEQLASLAISGDIDGLFGLMDTSTDGDRDVLAYKWLSVAADFGHEAANAALEDLQETSSLRYDDDRLQTGNVHFELGAAYLTGADGLPRDLDRGRAQLGMARERNFPHSVDDGPRMLEDLRARVDDEGRAVVDDVYSGEPPQQPAAAISDGGDDDGDDDDDGADDPRAADDGDDAAGAPAAGAAGAADDDDDDDFGD